MKECGRRKVQRGFGVRRLGHLEVGEGKKDLGSADKEVGRC